MFIDRVKLHLVAGRGGDGIIAWRRAKYLPKGGPYGGDGGKGGSIILEVNSQLNSLEAYRNKRKIKAESGQAGGSSNRKGKNGKDLILTLPNGTLVKDAETGEILYDFTEGTPKTVICEGGKGGRGNSSFATPTNRTPYQFTAGKPGQELFVEFELKLIAQIGLVGFPNAGKSTLFSALTDIPVKIAPYPFTTLQPHIGIIEKEDYTRLFIADIPGIIEEAHENRGLGLEFLRHIERTELLIYVLDASGLEGRNPFNDFEVLRAELKAYNPELLHKDYLIVLNKIDVEGSQLIVEEFKANYSGKSKNVFAVSSLSGEGIDALLERLKRS